MFGRVCQKGRKTVVVFPDFGEMVRDMLFCVVFGGLFYSLPISFVGACWWGLLVRLNLIGLVEMSCGMICCFTVR
jgi:hypothetical protein